MAALANTSRTGMTAAAAIIDGMSVLLVLFVVTRSLGIKKYLCRERFQKRRSTESGIYALAHPCMGVFCQVQVVAFPGMVTRASMWRNAIAFHFVLLSAEMWCNTAELLWLARKGCY